MRKVVANALREKVTYRASHLRRGDQTKAKRCQSQTVRAREADGHERDRLWDRLVARQAAYEKYASATDRPIPIVILEPNYEGSDA